MHVCATCILILRTWITNIFGTCKTVRFMAYIVLKFYASTPTTVSAEGRPYAALVRCYIYPDITFS